MARDDDTFLQGLIAERERLLDIQSQARAAKVKLTEVNKLIAKYGNDASDANVDHAIENATKRVPMRVVVHQEIPCTEKGCKHDPFTTLAGLAMHRRRAHNLPGKIPADTMRRFSTDKSRKVKAS